MLFIFFYLLLSALSWIYGHGKFDNNAEIHFIVILSGDFDWDTLKRIERGIELSKTHKESKIVVCGKYKLRLINNTLKRLGIKNTIIQNKSTNTFQDAFFLKEALKNTIQFPIVLVTSRPHSRRSIHTFQKVFPNAKIYTFPTNDFLNLYSPLLPSGWIAILINIFKDYKYNGRFI